MLRGGTDKDDVEAGGDGGGLRWKSSCKKFLGFLSGNRGFKSRGG